MSTYLSIAEAAADLHVANWTIWKRVRSGQIPALRIGRVFRIAVADWDAYKRRALVVPPAPTVADRVGGVALIDRVLQRGNS